MRRNPYMQVYESPADPMRSPFPWLHEEMSADGTRLTRRCSEIDGGCGESVEVPAARSSRGWIEFPGFIAWYRKHTRCGQEATHA